uniref:Ig-like domain-containing protein n=1 Tax=Xiphophorus couchianus TaxID=32473 RepID=A0A3B5KRY4_9TELE
MPPTQFSCSLIWRVLSHALAVSQSADVSVLEGKTVNVTCCWTDTGDRVGLKWLKNQTLIENKTVMSQSEGSWREHENKCENLTLGNIKRTDSGTYICKVSVEIPVLIESEGAGTTIRVCLVLRDHPLCIYSHLCSLFLVGSSSRLASYLMLCSVHSFLLVATCEEPWFPLCSAALVVGLHFWISSVIKYSLFHLPGSPGVCLTTYTAPFMTQFVFCMGARKTEYH